MNSFSFCLSGKLNLSYNSEWLSCWVENSCTKVFFLLVLWICHPLLLARNVSVEKISLYPYVILVYKLFFSCCFYDFHLCLTFTILVIYCAWCLFGVILFKSVLGFLDLDDCFLPQTKEVFIIPSNMSGNISCIK